MTTTSDFPVRRTFITTLILLLALPARVAAQAPESGQAWQPNASMMQPGASAPQSGGAVAAIENAAAPSAVVDAYVKARADAPTDPQLAVAYVHRMVALGAPQFAQKQAQEVLQYNPNDGVAWAVLAFCSGAMNNTTAALNELTSATRLAPDEEFVQYTAGQLLGWYDALGKASELPPGLPEKLQLIKKDFANRPAFAETYKDAFELYKQQPAAGTSAGASAGAVPAAGSSSTSTPVDTQLVTPPPSATVSQAVPPSDASELPPPERVVIAEKVPFELPNGQTLVLSDHKVGHDRIRYEVDGIEFKPHVGEAVAFPGPNYLVLVTCTRWKLLKKYYGRDSAEFQIECVPQPASQPPVESPVEYTPQYYPTYIVPTYYPVHPAWSVGVGFAWGSPWWGGWGWGRHYGSGWYSHGWHGYGFSDHATRYGHAGFVGAVRGANGAYGAGGFYRPGGGFRSFGGGSRNVRVAPRGFSNGGRSFGGGGHSFGGGRGVGGGGHGR